MVRVFIRPWLELASTMEYLNKHLLEVAGVGKFSEMLGEELHCSAIVSSLVGILRLHKHKPRYIIPTTQW